MAIDSYLPSCDRESGSRRLLAILKMFLAIDYRVIFVADSGKNIEPLASVLQELGIEILVDSLGDNFTVREKIKRRLPFIDLAWICRPELNEKYFDLIRQNPKIKLIYDTVDLHYLRLKRHQELIQDRNDSIGIKESAWQNMRVRELTIARQADLTITVTATEQKILQQQGIKNIAVIPNIHLPYQGKIPYFDRREGILFIGSYNHLPNIDAVKWLCREIMPLVWQTIPYIKVTLLGSNPTPEIKSLANDKITVTGYIPDVTPYFLSHKLSVSPLRYGAGMKGKIGHSLEYALPVISTSIGTEGMNLINEKDVLEANNTQQFAEQIIRLYTDSQLWHKLSSNCHKAIASYSPDKIQKQLSTTVGI